MRYDEFRDRFHYALCEAGLLSRHIDRPIETIDLTDTARRWEVYTLRSSPQDAEPFHVSAKIAFEWNPIEAARTYTTEEDLLTDLVGRKQSSMKTERRWIRTDLVLRAMLPYGSKTPMPEPQTLGSWIRSVNENMDRLLTEIKGGRGRMVAVMGSREEVKIEVQCSTEGVLSLYGVSVSGFRIVRVPRIWDDPDRRRAEKGIGEQLDRIARRFKEAMEEWNGRIAELARWIRYEPPAPEEEQMERQFEEEDDEGHGSETIH